LKAHNQQSFTKSATSAEKGRCLMKAVGPDDTLGILINADPDAMASASALKRIFWRKAKKILIYHINSVQRTDNLAFIRLLRIEQQHLRHLRPSLITKWAVVDSQPQHYSEFRDIPFDIVIDHHPCEGGLTADFVDVRENYGATATIMTEYLRGLKITPSQRLATALYYGIKTDTDNFVRGATLDDISAFRYLYKYSNRNIIQKIESSEITRKTLTSYKLALEKLTFVKDKAFVHLGEVENPDILVIIADFFTRLAEATWSIVSGTYKDKLIVIFRNADFRGNAGKTAQKLFERWGASAGGHKNAARAEVPLASLPRDSKGAFDPAAFMLRNIRGLKENMKEKAGSSNP
jgi:nanoRNase/pAp phosphatase (c-di-AMP/oligoRNAs hydrolase)